MLPDQWYHPLLRKQSVRLKYVDRPENMTVMERGTNESGEHLNM